MLTLSILIFSQVPCGIFDDPAIVAEIKQASETIRKAMVQSNDLHAGLTAANSAQELNQMVRLVKIIDSFPAFASIRRRTLEHLFLFCHLTRYLNQPTNHI